jgi:type VI secretion system protein ImpH
LRLGALLVERDLTALALETALADLLEEDLGEAAVSIEQFVGSWAEVAPDQLTRLGRSSTHLGRDLLVGHRVFDRAGKYRIVIGPLSRDGYAHFAESAEPLRRIAQLVATVLSEPLEYEVVLWLSREAAPSLQLTSTGKTRLGKNAWLGGQAREARVKMQVPSLAAT